MKMAQEGGDIVGNIDYDRKHQISNLPSEWGLLARQGWLSWA